ncbi:hypothetical protein M1L60_42675 [Actinoplanes sp. TRM 88003]|uniref:Uncharacterized protein n=1 Tax=Paractinoplanes aksuensis TaxID=2939490 RepID=A0ABT1E370_9ACTN|nr:hypothetical protein [Actinoplanes aksuensis]MCO8277303.1 hypothetical protein [Actinoplanes aksuensis]
MNVVAEMLLTQPTPMAIWALLILLTFPALLVLGSPEAMRRPRQAAQEFVAALRGHHTTTAREQIAEAARFADEVRVAADRAEAGAQRRQAAWERSETELNDAYAAWLDADARLRTATAAAAWGTPWSVRTCDEYAARQRYLHVEVTAAAARGDLPTAAVADALAERAGWDARLHPVDQHLVITRASVAWLRQRYEQAVIAERTAWHDADAARRASNSLTREALAAEARVVPVPHARPTARTTRHTVPAPAI